MTSKYTVYVDIHLMGIAIEADDEGKAMQKVLNLIDEAIKEPLEYSLGPHRAEGLPGDDPDDEPTLYKKDAMGDLIAYPRLKGRKE